MVGTTKAESPQVDQGRDLLLQAPQLPGNLSVSKARGWTKVVDKNANHRYGTVRDLLKLKSTDQPHPKISSGGLTCGWVACISPARSAGERGWGIMWRYQVLLQVRVLHHQSFSLLYSPCCSCPHDTSQLHHSQARSSYFYSSHLILELHQVWCHSHTCILGAIAIR